MERTIVASFATRREADLAIEHLVQQHGIDRTDVFVGAPGEANSAGTKAAGADVESGHPGVKRMAALNSQDRSKYRLTVTAVKLPTWKQPSGGWGFDN